MQAPELWLGLGLVSQRAPSTLLGAYAWRVRCCCSPAQGLGSILERALLVRGGGGSALSAVQICVVVELVSL